MTKSEYSGEVGAMAAIESAFANLDDEAKGRVLRWAADRFGLAPKIAASAATAMIPTAVNATHAKELAPSELADLYAAATPHTEAEKALVVAYWLQFVKGQPDLESQQINGELKQLGHGVANITQALEVLKRQKPQLVVQTRKEGTTRQARKKYRVTEEGKKVVQQMASGNRSE